MKLAAVGNPGSAETESRQLVSDLLHQLSQPLTTLCCSLELGLLQSETEEPCREVVSRALVQAERASSLAIAMRELFDAAQVGEDSENLELSRAVEDAVNDLMPVAESAGIELRCFYRSPCPVWFDAPRLRQGLFHLIGSVIASCMTGHVRIELEEHPEDVALGLTIAGQNLGRRPSPEDSDRELQQRLGMGIARAIFEAAGGSFSGERNACGLNVEVRLPRHPGQS